LGLLVVKIHLAIQFVDSISLKHLVMQLWPQVVFPSQKTFNQEMLLNLVEKTKPTCVLLILVYIIFVIVSFDL
jgi:hypothetical protein